MARLAVLPGDGLRAVRLVYRCRTCGHTWRGTALGTFTAGERAALPAQRRRGFCPRCRRRRAG